MASITIRRLDEQVKRGLRLRAAAHGRSMEAEARVILEQAVSPSSGEGDLASRIRARVAPFGGVDLALPPRPPEDAPVSFD